MSPHGSRADRLLAPFDELVELHGGARAARLDALDALRAQDEALAGALPEMLAADDVDGGVLDRGMAAMASAIGESLSVGVPESAAGRRASPGRASPGHPPFGTASPVLDTHHSARRCYLHDQP